MSKRIATLSLIVSLVAVPLFALDAAWTAALSDKQPERLHVNLTRGRHHQMGTTMSIAAFSGLSTAAVSAQVMTPVEFRLQREAGTAQFEGTFRAGKGAGQMTFTANRAYRSAVEALGVKFTFDADESEEEMLFALALHDVSTAFIRSMQAEGYRVSLEKYLAMRIFDITPEYIREMRSLGFNDIDDDELIATRIHKVTPQYVRETRAAGWKLSLDELQASRIHGATPEFAAEMKRLGYGDLDPDELVAFRIHGVTPKLIAELRTLGYDRIDADDLVAMRIHRVTPEYIRDLERAGYSGIPVDKLLSMRIHGVDPTRKRR